MPNVFYIECSGRHWVRIAETMQRESGWKPAYWTGSRDTEIQAKQAFSDTVFHLGVDAARGIPAREYADEKALPALDSVSISALAECESITLNMMDRMDPDGRSFSHDERRRHYYDLLRYWLAVLEREQPDRVIFAMSPHIVFDYVLYTLCRYRNIPTVLFDRIACPGLLYSMSDFLAGSHALRDTYINKLTQSRVDLSEEMEQFYRDQTAGGSKAIPPNFKTQARAASPGRRRPSAALDDYLLVPPVRVLSCCYDCAS